MENIETQETNNKKPNKLKLYAIGAVLLVIAYSLGFASGEGKVKVNNGKIEINKGNAVSTSADYSLLWDALDLLNQKYVDRPLDQQKLMYGAVAGLVAAAGDPYTAFFDPEQAKSFTEQLQGSFSGIGAEIGIKDGQIVVIAPLDGNPAQKAGIQAGDAIVAIDGKSTEGISTDQAVSQIRGPSGTTVKLSVVHPKAKTVTDISIVRSKIEIKSVKLDTKEVDGKKIAVIKISQFGDDTKGLLDHVVDVVSAGNYSGIVLDLRNNPGGYLETAVSTISDWVDPGQVAVQEKGYGGSEKLYKTAGIPRLKGIKTVVLGNGGSASASEIVTGALQDYGVAKLVGEKTFGKGSVQELQDLKDNTEIKITVAKWYTPKGRGIHKIGLEPDVKVELTQDDFNAGKDPQMDKALEMVTQ